MKTVLFVCTGNTCRSCMAEGMLRKMLEEAREKTKGIQVISAGTATMKGLKASKNAIQIMGEKGIDLGSHGSTPVTKGLIEEAHLILTMTRNHKEQVLQIAPKVKEKVHTLKEYVGKIGDILDPFGQSRSVYRACAKEIEEGLELLVKKIVAEIA